MRCQRLRLLGWRLGTQCKSRSGRCTRHTVHIAVALPLVVARLAVVGIDFVGTALVAEDRVVVVPDSDEKAGLHFPDQRLVGDRFEAAYFDIAAAARAVRTEVGRPGVVRMVADPVGLGPADKMTAAVSSAQASGAVVAGAAVAAAAVVCQAANRQDLVALGAPAPVRGLETVASAAQVAAWIADCEVPGARIYQLWDHATYWRSRLVLRRESCRTCVRGRRTTETCFKTRSSLRPTENRKPGDKPKNFTRLPI